MMNAAMVHANRARRITAPPQKKCHGDPQALETVLSKLISDLSLERIDRLPASVHDFNPDGWLLYVTNARRDGSGGEYVAVNPLSSEVRFLGEDLT